MANRVVLVIDDEKEVCRIIKEGLERRGRFKIITAYNGQDGFHMAQRAQPDLVLLDIDMPWMNGFRVLELLKEDSKTYSIPVFMLTGHNADDYKIAASRLYCEDYITKPMSLKELEAKIDVVLTRCGI